MVLRGRALVERVKANLQDFSMQEGALLPTARSEPWKSDMSCGECSGGCPRCGRKLPRAVGGCVQVSCRLLDLADLELARLIRAHRGSDEVRTRHQSRKSALVNARRLVRGDPNAP